MTCAALSKLIDAHRRTGSLLSVGIEPCPEYLPDSFPATIEGYERFWRLVIEATAESAAAYKPNLAHFEALGPDGWRLLYRLREAIPPDALYLADAKRGDIGSTAKLYARALYETAGFDAATVNPLLGRDACEPFLEYRDKLTFFLVLTSNPGAQDFFGPSGLPELFAKTLPQWSPDGNCGFVVGATQSESAAEIRALAPEVPWLVPGLGAQGGDAAETVRAGRAQRPDGFPGLLFHVTRGILPPKDLHGDPLAIVRERTREFAQMVAGALESRTTR